MLASGFRERNAELGGLFVTVVCLYVADLTGRITLSAGGLIVEAVDGGRSRVMRMNPAWVRVAADEGGCTAVILRERDREITVARFVAEWERRQFAQDLKCALTQF